MIALLLLACAGKGDTGAEIAPSLTAVQGEVFTPSCAFSTCHAAPGASGLVLEEGSSWGALVNVESAAQPGSILVIPGDADGSYLIARLRGDSGDLMPPNSPLEAERLQLVVDWINAGAAQD